MKIYFRKFIIMAGCSLLMLSSCKKQDNPVYYTGGTAPVLSASATDSIPLHFTDSAKNAVTFSWTNPNYEFSNGISSLNVTYYLDIDTLGGNFSSPVLQTVSIASDLSKSYTEGAFNSMLANGMSLSTGQPHQIQARVTAFLATNELPLNSSVLNFTVTPYAPPPVLAPPASGTLYIVGSAVGSWNNPVADANAQIFTQVSPTEYKITTKLIGGQEYKFIAVNGSWSQQWSVATGDTYPNGGPLVFNGNNCIAPSTTGTYVIDVNFQTGKFTVTPQ